MALYPWMLLALLVTALEMRGLDGAVLRPLEPARALNVLVFVTSDCPVSNGYAPEIQRICRASAAAGSDCMLVYEDVGAGGEELRRHRTEFGYGAMPAVYDSDGRLAARAGATVTPEVAVVDRSGAVRYLGRIDDRYIAIGRQRRTVTAHDLEDALAAVLAGRRVAAARTQATGCFIVPPDKRRKSP